MPREGYKTVTVRETLYQELCKKAKEMQCSLPECIEYLLKEQKPERRGK